MKKQLIFVLTFFCFLINGSCQLSGIGLNAGATISSFDYPQPSEMQTNLESGNKAGGTGGICFDFDLGAEYIKFSPELYAIRNGSKEYYSNAGMLFDDLAKRVTLDYVGLYLPFTLFIALNPEDEDTFNGIYFQGKGFADYSFNGTIADSKSGESKVDFKNDLDKIDFGIGAEVGFVFKGIKLMFGYNMGIKNIKFSSSVPSAVPSSDNYLINNKGFLLTLGYVGKLEKD